MSIDIILSITHENNNDGYILLIILWFDNVILNFRYFSIVRNLIYLYILIKSFIL